MNQTEYEQSIAWVAVVAGCLIEQDGRFLLVQEVQPKVYGLWNLPAGKVDKGESIEDAAVREVREEAGYDVKLGEQVGLYHDSISLPVIHIFTAEITGGSLKAQQGEILDAKWMTRDEIKVLNDEGKLRTDWIWELVRK